MGFADKRLLSWLSELDEAEPVHLGDIQRSAKFTFDGIPKEKQTLEPSRPSGRPAAETKDLRQSPFELECSDHPRLPDRPTTAGTGSRISRIEKNGYERIPRAKTKEDRYEYKGKDARVKNRATTAAKKKSSKQKRKHTINAEFHASNVPSNRLTLHPATNLGIFNKGKRSSPVKTRELDHAFSETKFLSKGQMLEETDTAGRPLRNLNMLGHVGELQHSKHTRRAQRELLESVIEAAAQQQLSRLNNEPHQADTAMYAAPETCSPPKSITAAMPFSQPFSRDKEQEPTGGPITSSPQKQTMSPGDGQGSMQPLDFDLHTSDRKVTEAPDKAYWTLEDLKILMQQRMSAWKPEREGSKTTLIRSQQGSRKRKHTSSQGEAATEKKAARKRRHQNLDNRQHIEVTNRSTSLQTPIMDTTFIPGGCVDYPLGDLIPGDEQLHAAVQGNISGSRPFVDNELSLLYDESYLISQAFDAAYEAIMRSEQDVPIGFLEHTPATLGNVDNGNCPALAIHNTRASSIMREETLYPYHYGQEMFSPHEHNVDSAFPLPEDRRYTQQSYTGAPLIDREPLRSIDRNSVWSLGRVLREHSSETNGLDLEVGPMKSFWRQNKLY